MIINFVYPGQDYKQIVDSIVDPKYFSAGAPG